MLSLVALLFFQMTAERLEGVQVRWPAIPNATEYAVSRQAGVEMKSWRVRTPAVTDTTAPSGALVYTVTPIFNGTLGDISYTAAIPPQPDIQITLNAATSPSHGVRTTPSTF